MTKAMRSRCAAWDLYICHASLKTPDSGFMGAIVPGADSGGAHPRGNGPLTADVARTSAQWRQGDCDTTHDVAATVVAGARRSRFGRVCVFYPERLPQAGTICCVPAAQEEDRPWLERMP